MPRRPPTRSRAPLPPKPRSPRKEARRPPRQGSSRAWLWTGVCGLAIVGAGILLWAIVPEDPARLKARAEAAARAGDWAQALSAWRAFNLRNESTAATHLAEARACLALGRAAQAERALRRA